jgi:hypothetical protein
MFSYNAKNFHALMTEHKGLLTFTDVASWDQRASAEVEQIVNAIQDADEKSADVSRKLEQVKKEHAEKNFIARLFSSQRLAKSLSRLILNYSIHKMGLDGLASQLQEARDFTPNSPEEKTSLLKELNVRKKELQVEKSELAAAKRAIRTDARKQNAHVGIRYSSKLAASERRSIRYKKEAALRPLEDAKTAIERQLIQVDHDILWAERLFK